MRLAKWGLAALLAAGQLGTAASGSARAESPAGQTDTNMVTDTTDTTSNTTSNTYTTSSTNSASASSAVGKLVLTVGSAAAFFEGKTYIAARPAVVKNGVTYVALRFMAERLGASLAADPATGDTVLLSGGIELRYKPGSKLLKAGGTVYMMKGAPYADRYALMVPVTSFAQGLNLPLSVSGSSLALQLQAANPAPQAYFETDKSSYRIGEPVQFQDLSTDDEEGIVERTWKGRQAAYFEPGNVTITLSVKDRHGSVSAYSRTIQIEDEVLYTKEAFDLLYAPVGQNIAVDGYAVKTMEALPYTYRSEGPLLIRSSGPETVTEDGILYGEVADGPVRFLLHHKNKTGKKARLHILATNEGTETATLTPGPEGTGGPTYYPGLAGKMSLARFLSAVASGTAGQAISLAPGQSVELFDSLRAASPIPDDEVVTFTGELVSDTPIRYTVLLTASDRDPIASLPNLPALDPRESIVRGTFAGSTRTFDYAEPVGDRIVKLSLTDNTADPFQEGTDGILNTIAKNSGNYGLLYWLKLRKVAPHTLIAFNPRGGMYTGAALVNGQTVTFSHLGASGIQNEASVLYRTGDNEEEVNIAVSPAAGSNLPFCLLFIPMPDPR